MGEGFVPYEHVRTLCKANPISSWAAYIGGSIFTLLKEESIHLPFGFSLLLLSGVPMNVGIGSSASTEIATLYCLQSYLQLNLSESRLAQLGQLAENLNKKATPIEDCVRPPTRNKSPVLPKKLWIEDGWDG